MPPLGKMNIVRDGSSASSSSILSSSTWVCRALNSVLRSLASLDVGGVAMHEPTSSSLDWTHSSVLAIAHFLSCSASSATNSRAMPIKLDSSSQSPNAWKTRLVLSRRSPL